MNCESMTRRCSLPVALLFVATSVGYAQDARELQRFEPDAVPANVAAQNAEVSIVDAGGEPALQIQFAPEGDSWVAIQAPEGVWDCAGSAGVAVELGSASPDDVIVNVRLENPGPYGTSAGVSERVSVSTGETVIAEVEFGGSKGSPFWGMRGVPLAGRGSRDHNVDATQLAAIRVYPEGPGAAVAVQVRVVRTFGEAPRFREAIPFPFIDRFGQFMHDTWPGKVADESALAQNAEQETLELAAQPVLPGRDEYGGWADGPQLEASGYFRTEKLDGRWWLVTPSGHLFLSMGMNCVHRGDYTFVTGREDWFSELPPSDDPQLASCYSETSGAHSMAERVGGKGVVFNHYRANLIRKYGEGWDSRWKEVAEQRLTSWGFNTLGNWCDGQILAESSLPYVATAGVGGAFRRIEGGGGYWSKMPDVFDPSFEEAVKTSVPPNAKRIANDPRCIGIFVDNELAWEAIGDGTLASPPDQPCRATLIAMLQEKYANLDALNAAWETTASSWDALRAPSVPNPTSQSDLDAYIHAFATRYFTLVRDAVKQEAPNHLYMGCRFALVPLPAAQACAEVADVVSFNFYRRGVGPDSTMAQIDAPVIIGEFHFGALDRGMFHPGLVMSKDQEDRAASYAQYVNSVLDQPNLVGCHWFQYMDQPTTGRSLDGENYGIGFVSITDTPYPEMVDVAREVHGKMYARHAGGVPPSQDKRGFWKRLFGR
ncbi:MAG: hydrolase [Candidatus Hydrogenedentota bacterium]